MPTDSKVTVESTYRNPIPVEEILRFIVDVGHYVGDDAELHIHQDPEIGPPTDPGGTITIKATGSRRPHPQKGATR